DYDHVEDQDDASITDEKDVNDDFELDLDLEKDAQANDSADEDLEDAELEQDDSKADSAEDKQVAPTVIDVEDIEAIISKLARIPPKSVSNDDKSLLQHLERDLNRLVFGQSEAIKTLSDAIKLSRAGLKSSDKPIGSFMFAGPT
ncbi:ATP-dependent Clp protease ATP-binding subunit, partial [Leptospira borgpetersenii serovar Balcanica]|nr:ATP-dependent Clp protease ATP-binding subunit [Leptospira borgpetersenii serovar Balcanica]